MTPFVIPFESFVLKLNTKVHEGLHEGHKIRRSFSNRSEGVAQLDLRHIFCTISAVYLIPIGTTKIAENENLSKIFIRRPGYSTRLRI